MIPYLKFLLKSTNQHGVHSPFVFKFLTECVYKKPQLSENKVQDVLLKSTVYFGYKNLAIEGNQQLKVLVESKFTNLNLGSEILDLLYFKSPLASKIPIEKLHNDSMVLIDQVHRTDNDYSNWLGHANSSQISVSIDFYHCGVLFVRKEQEKEHFNLRL